MGDSDEKLLAGLPETVLLQSIRELMGDEDMDEEELRTAWQSGILHELCPDLARYAREKMARNAEAAPPPEDQRLAPESPPKEEKSSSDEEEPPVEHKEAEVKPENVKVKWIDCSDSESDSSKRSRHKSKKKKKHKHKDHKKERDDRKHSSDKHEKVKKETKRDSSPEIRRREEKAKKPKKKRAKVIMSSSGSGSSSDSEDERKRKHESSRNNVKKEVEEAPAKVKTEREEKPKVHPYYMEKGGQSSNKVVDSVKVEKVEKPPEKKEPKPFSKYNSTVSSTSLRKWKPFLHRDHLRYQRRCRLKAVSVVCVDLLDLPLVFHHPRCRPANPASLALKSHLTITSNRVDLVRRLEREKASSFKKRLNRKAMKILKQYKSMKRNGCDSDDGRRDRKSKMLDRIVSSGSSSGDSDTSSVLIPNRKMGGGKMTKADREAEAKRRKLEEVKRKAFATTRKLPWEKGAYFTGNKKKEDPVKEKEKALLEKKRRLEQKKKEQAVNAPTMKFQKILAQIDAANKAEALKPKVELKIPKINPKCPPTEYKVERAIGINDVAKEVTRLLSSAVNVECPVMPETSDDFGEFTVKKIAWWLLKNEKDPAPVGVYHPECHDDDDEQSDHDDDFEWPDDMSSVNGCVSDPEGLYTDKGPDPLKVNDPDWADDYCGAASLYTKIRKADLMKEEDRKKSLTTQVWESLDAFRSFLRIKPGTNYEKPNFEAKCFVCNSMLRGQRHLGAHIRSEAHKNQFRNYSLAMAGYEERVEPAVPRKEFIAKLVEYAVNTNNAVAGEADEKSTKCQHRVGKIERVRSDSPGPLIAGEGAVEVYEMPVPDNISLPSIEDYDISSDESLLNVKVAIRTLGEWDDSLELFWRQYKDDEAIIAEQYNYDRERYINEPERHKNYQEEWLKFWDKRASELEAEGKDPETYNYQKDWMPFWLQRMQEIMKDEVEQRVAVLKRRLGVDKHTLRRKFGISAEETKRTKIKKKNKLFAQNDSSVKSSSKAASSDPNRSQIVPEVSHRNDATPKANCLPTPPKTSEDDRHFEASSGDRRGRNENSGPRKRDQRWERDDRQRRQYNSPNKFNSINCGSAVSSTSTDVPGEEKKREPKVPPPPTISDPKSSSNMLELNNKLQNELRERLKVPQDSRGGDARASTKPGSPVSSGSISSEPKKMKARRGSGESPGQGHDARLFRERMNDLTAAINNERKERTGTNERPKIKSTPEIPWKRRERRASTPEDGEVGSSGSSIAEPALPSGGIATFVNKDIPGLAELKRESNPLLQQPMGKHSFGSALQAFVRKKSTEDNTDADRPNSNPDHRNRPEVRNQDGHRENDRHDRSKTESRSKHDGDRDWHRNKHRGKDRDHHRSKDKDERHRDRFQRHHSKEESRSREDYRSNSHDYRASKGERRNSKDDFRDKNAKFANNTQPSSIPAPSLPQESWEPEDTWDASQSKQQCPPQFAPAQAPPLPVPPPVPEAGGHIPVIGQSQWAPQYNHNPNNYNPGNGRQNYDYNPYTSGPPNYNYY